MAWWKQRYSIGKVYNQIGYEKNKDVGLVETIYIQIGFEVNKDIGLVQIRQRNTHKQLQIGGLDEIG